MGRTSIPGIFASGDAVKGARTVVEAVAYSKNVAEAMHEYMQTLPPRPPRRVRECARSGVRRGKLSKNTPAPI